MAVLCGLAIISALSVYYVYVVPSVTVIARMRSLDGKTEYKLVSSDNGLGCDGCVFNQRFNGCSIHQHSDWCLTKSGIWIK